MVSQLSPNAAKDDSNWSQQMSLTNAKYVSLFSESPRKKNGMICNFLRTKKFTLLFLIVSFFFD
jgi:hypothetical protein